MKKFAFYCFIFVLIPVIGIAQLPPPVPNGLFSEWDSLPGGAEDPRYYTSINGVSLLQGNRIVARKTSDAHTGDYALEVTPLISPDTNTFLTASVVMGEPAIDTANLDIRWQDGGLGYRFHEIWEGPVGLYYYYKFTPSVGYIDSVFVILAVYQYNQQTDTMERISATGIYHMPTTDFLLGSTLQSGFGFTIERMDSISVSIHYKSNNTLANPTGKFVIDSLSLVHPSMLKNEVHKASSLQIYPNPFAQYLAFEGEQGYYHLELVDMNGKITMQSRLTDGQRINTLHLPPGNYVARLFDDNGKLLKEQKLIKSN